MKDAQLTVTGSTKAWREIADMLADYSEGDCAANPLHQTHAVDYAQVIRMGISDAERSVTVDISRSQVYADAAAE